MATLVKPGKLFTAVWRGESQGRLKKADWKEATSQLDWADPAVATCPFAWPLAILENRTRCMRANRKTLSGFLQPVLEEFKNTFETEAPTGTLNKKEAAYVAFLKTQKPLLGQRLKELITNLAQMAEPTERQLHRFQFQFSLSEKETLTFFFQGPSQMLRQISGWSTAQLTDHLKKEYQGFYRSIEPLILKAYQVITKLLSCQITDEEDRKKFLIFRRKNLLTRGETGAFLSQLTHGKTPKAPKDDTESDTSDEEDENDEDDPDQVAQEQVNRTPPRHQQHQELEPDEAEIEGEADDEDDDEDDDEEDADAIDFDEGEAEAEEDPDAEAVVARERALVQGTPRRNSQALNASPAASVGNRSSSQRSRNSSSRSNNRSASRSSSRNRRRRQNRQARQSQSQQGSPGNAAATQASPVQNGPASQGRRGGGGGRGAGRGTVAAKKKVAAKTTAAKKTAKKNRRN